MRVPTLGRRLYSVLMFVLVSVIGGVLMAGLLVPTAGIAAESGKTVAMALNSLPEELKVGPPSEGSKVLMGDGTTVLTTFYDQNRKNVTLDEVAPIMRQAQVGIEDQRFYQHGALDLRGTLRALVRSSSGSAQGGSTLTQQYVKLALLYDAAARNDVAAVEAANSRTISRKLLELRYAVALEKEMTKDQILERYLNIAFYGDKTYGVEAAAQHYFGVSAKDLSLPQAAMLAGIVRNPVTTNPIANVAAATERMRNVLDKLVEINVITPAQAADAKQYKFDKSKVVETPERGCTTSPYPHLCDYVTQVLLQQTTSLGSTKAERQNTLNRAGLTIYTHIDPRFQDAAQEAVSDLVAPTDPVNGVMDMIQPGTGVILAMAQSKYSMGSDTASGQTWHNFSASDAMNGVGGSEGGSTFKAFTLTAALLAGMDPIDDYIDSPIYYWFPNGTKFGGCNTSAAIYQSGGGWGVRQAGATGDFNMYLGATYSSNTFFTQLEKKVGVCNVVKAAEALGLKRADGASLITGIRPDGKLVGDLVDAEKPTFTLGNTPVTPLSLANAYATLAARGKRCDPIILKSITDTKNRNYDVPSANCQQVIPAEVADRVSDILHGPFSSEGTAARAAISGYMISGKTGTQTDAPTILTVGYTPDIVGLAILTSDAKHPEAIANKARYGDKNKPRLQSLRVHGTDYKSGYTLSGSSGGEAGAMVWKPAMVKVLPLLPHTQFVRPSESPYSDASTNAGVYFPRQSSNDDEETTQTTTSRPATSRPATTTTTTEPATTTTTGPGRQQGP